MDTQTVRNEFELDAFATYYEELSDTFIDIKKAAASLKGFIPKGAQIFEIGLGTGYFAEQFLQEGYSVCGIQPQDKMLVRLKKERPDVVIKSETKLESYTFDDHYNIIVSHSSVFLFTRIERIVGPNGEIGVSFVFQSFIDKLSTAFSLAKVLLALSPGGQFFINIQTNPLPLAEVGPTEDRFRFEMIRCVYSLDQEKVEKTFRTTYRGEAKTMEETHYCLRYSDFEQLLKVIGGKASITKDGQWIILERM